MTNYYYFAYGSNMCWEQMKKRCPNARFLTKAILNGYKFVYDGYSNYRGGAVANIVEFEGGNVEGGVFEIDDDCIKNLDHYEGYPKAYQRKIVKVQGENGQTYDAIVYLRKPLENGQPTEDYRNTILQGAKDCGLSRDYVKRFIE